jgi:hypothetical protein
MAERLLALLLCLITAAIAMAQVSPHGPIKFDCQTCHATDSWEMRKDAGFDHATTGFPLIGQHKPLHCASCHSGLKFASQSTRCLSCHTDVHKSELGENCVRCHTTQSWRIPDMVQKHQQTRFPLVGRHLTLNCESCHANASAHQYVGTSTTCIGCHGSDFQATKNPNHGTAGFSTECAKCHRVSAFTWGQGFDHDLTAFPLVGAHKTVACVTCHQDGRFKGTPTQCSSCHRGEYTSAASLNHPAARFSMECQTCHTPVSWRGARYDHTALTRFPLTGAHQPLQCSGCHGDNVFAGRSIECFSCHQNAFTTAVNPSHVAGNFNHDCTQCHSTANWSNATFNHNTTRFPLTGAHIATQCQHCHTNGNYQLVYTNCYQCHQTQFQQTTNPNHITGNFSHDCSQCHSTSNWSSATFNHNTTLFPLTGAHIAAACQSCHVNGNYQLHYTDCYQCHAPQFQQTTNPNHVTGNFSHDCTQCHSTTNWSSATFNHNTTLFPLTGAHIAATCQSCHVNGNYQLHYTDCYQCHAPQFQQTTNPNHVTGNFSHDCTQCHSTTNWSSATFNHNTTLFPLTGAHIATACQSCHVNGNYQLHFTDCYQCHQTQFAQPTNPNHALGNFSHDCRPCHTTTVWIPSTFSHGTTRFPLTGAHQAATCNSCHVNNQYQNLPMTCWDCHATDFNTTMNPNHVTGQFSHDCTQCHSTTGWSPASFNHNTTLFPLTGAHIATACQSCHVNGNYQLHYTDCYQCHQTRFAQPTNPNHVLGNFSHDCTPCHTTSVWMPSTFNHSSTQFPLTGAHQAVACNSCHVNNQYQNLPHACWDCHAADFNTTTNPNHVTGQFNHDCTQCHSTTGWSPATFNHNTTLFPLTGAHITASCQSCHVNGNYQLHYTDCYQCHQSDFQGVTNPNHVTQLFSHDCTPCHSTSVWTPNTMNHDTRWFRIYSGHHRNRWTQCTQCHPAPGNLTAFSCLTSGCHPQPQTNSEHVGRPGYVYESSACYSCHRNV